MLTRNGGTRYSIHGTTHTCLRMWTSGVWCGVWKPSNAFARDPFLVLESDTGAEDFASALLMVTFRSAAAGIALWSPLAATSWESSSKAALFFSGEVAASTSLGIFEANSEREAPDTDPNHLNGRNHQYE